MTTTTSLEQRVEEIERLRRIVARRAELALVVALTLPRGHADKLQAFNVAQALLKGLIDTHPDHVEPGGIDAIYSLRWLVRRYTEREVRDLAQAALLAVAAEIERAAQADVLN